FRIRSGARTRTSAGSRSPSKVLSLRGRRRDSPAPPVFCLGVYAEARMQSPNRLALALLLLATATAVPAQQPVADAPSLKGHIQSSEGRPLADAEVHVDGVRMGVRSGADGVFYVSSVPKGILTVSVRRI